MVRQYVQVTDQQRSQLVKLIHEHKYSIAKASKLTNIPYDNAKAINRTYTREQRVKKINYKQRYQTRRINHQKKVFKEAHLESDSESLSQTASARHTRSNIKLHMSSIMNRRLRNQIRMSEGRFPQPVDVRNEKQFMKDLGLEDFDMKVLDEDDSDFKELNSCKSSALPQEESPQAKKYAQSDKDQVSSPPELKVNRDPSMLRILTQQNSILTPNFGHTAKGFGQRSDLKNLQLLDIKEHPSPREFGRRMTVVEEAGSDSDSKSLSQIQITGQKCSNSKPGPLDNCSSSSDQTQKLKLVGSGKIPSNHTQGEDGKQGKQGDECHNPSEVTKDHTPNNKLGQLRPENTSFQEALQKLMAKMKNKETAITKERTSPILKSCTLTKPSLVSSPSRSGVPLADKKTLNISNLATLRHNLLLSCKMGEKPKSEMSPCSFEQQLC